MHFDFRSRPRQPRDLEPELRNLIDKALAEGRVKVVPPGVSGLPGYQYDPATGQIIREAPKAQAAIAAERRERFIKAQSAASAKRSEKAHLRREAIGAAMDAGKTAQEIAAERGETVAAVKEVMKHVRRLRREAAASDPWSDVK